MVQHIPNWKFDNWENPPQRKNEKEELLILLKDYEQKAIRFEGTSQEDIIHEVQKLLNPPERELSTAEFVSYFELLSDYCLGKITQTESTEQMKYFRRIEMIQDTLEEIQPISRDIFLQILKHKKR